MEEIYRRDSPFLSENLSESCTAELTRSNSGESSSPTVENSNDHLLQSRNATTDDCMGWTNEKHNTFLDCLEASFVEQLRRSIVLRAGRVELNRSCRNLSQKLSAPSDIASKQFTARRDGCSKINIESDQSELFVRKGDEYHHVTDLQLCARLRTEENQRRDKRTLSHVFEERSDLLFPFAAELQKPVSRIAEGSGQNFVDEDFEENSRSKKLKTAMMDTADDEQIVPKEQPTPCSSERKK
ncbi:cold-regulated protein 27-like [Nicotiana tabacum]|uniref:Uncharacterized protein n=2 Tax=Nicotiana TaxID=4085 RepID=A0A1S3XMY3_TOBAC|nr:PREDICTED: uncharacterized protein LOC104213970 [Nicotiana sylvestris]XP_016441335.1 PREDICTED: uncharacterized protein LOC107766939 [Nicotiana tabacum]BCT36637.1 uncharacterized protein [Nicotiana tabacum]